MARTTYTNWTVPFPSGLPEWAPSAILLVSLTVEVATLWVEVRAPQAQSVTQDQCLAFCERAGSTPKAWGSWSCECQPRPAP